jgi:hypothetical protein
MSDDMYMITSAAYYIGMTFFLFLNTGYIRKKYILIFSFHERYMVLASKYHLVKNLGVG